MITDEQVIKALDAYYGIEHVGGARFNLISTMRKALEAYEQSKWVKFDEYNGETYPEKEEVVLLKTRHGLISGWLCIEENPCSSNPDNHYDACFVCFDGIHEIGLNDVVSWQPLPEFKE